jgi:hypothetical protein
MQETINKLKEVFLKTILKMARSKFLLRLFWTKFEYYVRKTYIIDNEE